VNRLLVALCLLSLVAVGGLGPLPGDGTASAAPTLSVSNVTVSPNHPTTGETVSIEITLENSPSADPKPVNAIALRKFGGGSFTEITRVSGVGAVTPGSTITVPLYADFGSPGSHRLQINVYGDRNLQFPVLVDVVREGSGIASPKIDADVVEMTAGAESTTNLTIANSLPRDVLGAEVTIRGEGISATDDRRTFSRIGSGEKRVVPVEFTPTDTGTVTATATLRYTTAEGTDTVSEDLDFEVEPARPSLAFDASTRVENGSTEVVVDLTNTGNAPITGITIADESNATDLRREVTEQLSPDERRTVRVPVGDVAATGRVSVPLRATYDAAGASHEATAQVSVAANPGAIQLTGVRVEREGARLHLSGSTSNVGLSTANAVLVEVVNTGNVTPAAPNRDYFVGAVPQSEFVTFDVYARVTGATASIPVRVEYLVDGQRRSQVFDVPLGSAVDPAAGPPEAADGEESAEPSTGVGPVHVAFGVAVAAVVFGLMVLGWRRSRGRD